MENNNTSRQLFLQKLDNKCPVELKSVSQTYRGSAFYNSNVGSRLIELASINFQYSDNAHVKISSVTIDTTSNLNIIGMLRWLSDVKTVHVGRARMPRRVREATFADDTGNITLSIWGDLIDEIKENTVCESIILNCE